MSEQRMTIEFALTDECGNRFTQSSCAEIFHEYGETELEYIGRQLNTFLRQCGYYREHNYLLMEDITEDECEALTCYLDMLRSAEGGFVEDISTTYSEHSCDNLSVYDTTQGDSSCLSD